MVRVGIRGDFKVRVSVRGEVQGLGWVRVRVINTSNPPIPVFEYLITAVNILTPTSFYPNKTKKWTVRAPKVNAEIQSRCQMVLVKSWNFLMRLACTS